MDLEVVEVGIKDLLLPTQLEFSKAIDQYTSYLTSFTQEIIERVVLQAKPSKKATLQQTLEIG